MKIIGAFPKTRLRRLRKSKWMRDIISENNLSNKDLILPIFVREGKNKVESIKSMPNVKRYSIDKLPIDEDEKFVLELIPRINTDFPGDRGLFCPFILNCMKLKPGEGFFIGQVTSSTGAVGDIVRWEEMPRILAPVPQVTDGAVDTPTGRPAQLRALYLPKGQNLRVARQSDANQTTAPLVGCQGGWY